MNIIVRAAVLLGLAGAVACGAAVGQGAGGAYTQQASYRGKVSAQILTPDGSGNAKPQSGTGSARFVPAGGGRARLEVSGSIRRNNDTGFVVDGSSDGAGWRGRSEALSIAIDRDGDISGGGIENDHRITFDGRATAERIDLVVTTEKLSKSGGETLPPGTRIVFDYALTRSDARSARAGPAPSAERAVDATKAGKKTCKRRVWKMRNVATPGGGMTMTQVPHCLD